MEGSIARSRRLVGVSLRLVLRDRTLLAVVGATILALSATIAVTFLAVHPFRAPGRMVVWSLVEAFPASFVVTFFNVALAAATDAALRGERMSLGGALRVPVRRIGRVLAWSLITAGVGRLIAAVSRWLPFAPWLTELVLGAAWALLTLFAIPVIALEDRSALDGAKRSMALVRERWREGAAGYAGISLAAAVPMLALVPLVVAWTVLMIAGLPAVAWVVASTGAVILVGSLAAMLAAENVFTVALYRYAVSGEAAVFPAADLQGAITPRKRG